MAARDRYRIASMVGTARTIATPVHPRHTLVAAATPPVPRALDVRPTRVAIDPATGLVAIEVEFVVERPWDEVKVLLDPQNWDLGGKHFHPNGTYLAGLYAATPELCFHCGEGFKIPEAPGLPAGTDYPWRILYEHFHASDPAGFDVAFDNLLWVNPDIMKTADGRPRYVVHYALHTPLAGRVDFVHDVRFLRDDGDVTATWEAPNRTRVRMRKNVRFTSQWANVTTYFAYRYEGRAVAEDVADVTRARLPPYPIPLPV